MAAAPVRAGPGFDCRVAACPQAMGAALMRRARVQMLSSKTHPAGPRKGRDQGGRGGGGEARFAFIHVRAGVPLAGAERTRAPGTLARDVKTRSKAPRGTLGATRPPAQPGPAGEGRARGFSRAPGLDVRAGTQIARSRPGMESGVYGARGPRLLGGPRHVAV